MTGRALLASDLTQIRHESKGFQERSNKDLNMDKHSNIERMSLTEKSVPHSTRFVGSVPRKTKITACSLVMTCALVWGMMESKTCASLQVLSLSLKLSGTTCTLLGP